MSVESENLPAPNWLSELELKREKRLKARLGHEAGAGAPCIKCSEKCPGLDLHFWRKICKNCKCSKEDHDVHDDDIYGWAQFQLLGSKPNRIKKKIVLPGKKDEVELDWAPKGNTETIDRYLKTLSPESLPVKGSQAAQARKQLLQKQIPIHDIDPTLCHELTDSELAKMQDYIKHMKDSAGVGQVIQYNVNAKFLTNRYPKGVPSIETVQLLGENKSGTLTKQFEKLGVQDQKELDAFFDKIPKPHNMTVQTEKFGYVTQLTVDQEKLGYGVEASTNTEELGLASQIPANSDKHAQRLVYNYSEGQDLANSGPNFAGNLETNKKLGYVSQAQLTLPHNQDLLPSPPNYARIAEINQNTGDGDLANLAALEANRKLGYVGQPPLAQLHSQELSGLPANYAKNVEVNQNKGSLSRFAREQMLHDPQVGYVARAEPGSTHDPQVGYVPRAEPGSTNEINRNTMYMPHYAPGKLNVHNEQQNPSVIGNVRDLAFGTHDLTNSNYNKPLEMYTPNKLTVAENQLVPNPVKIGAIRDISYDYEGPEIKSAIQGENKMFEGMEVACKVPDDVEIQTKQCRKCSKFFEPGEFGIFVEKSNALYHSECFKCAGCNQSLADLFYFYDKESDNIYCGRDFAKIRGIPRCKACDELIFVKEYCLAENSTFHLKHFCCFECDQALAGQNYVVEESQPVCLPCFEKLKANKCLACRRVIMADEEGVKLKDGIHFHLADECFCCFKCKKPLHGAKLLFRNNKLYCSHDCFGNDQ
jgi:hypothetical protein